jgi:hypothetical protein
MRYIFTLLLCGTGVFASAQSYAIADYSSPEHPVSPVFRKTLQAGDYQVAKPPGLRMRNTGRTLTILGSAMLIGGIIVYSGADEGYYTSYYGTNGSYEEGDPQAAVGILMIVGGAGMTVPGIIFWSKGSKKYKRYLEQQNASVGFTGRGLALRYRF